jgi:hypothetical protein
VLRHLIGWSVPAIALAGLYVVHFAGGATAGTLGLGLVALVGLLVGAAAELHGRLHPRYGPVADRLGLTLWILPGLLVVAIGLVLTFFAGWDPFLLRGLPLVGAALCGLTVLAQDREIALADESGGWTKPVVSFLTYIAAIVLFTIVYQTKETSLLTATSTAALAGLLSLVMLRDAPTLKKRAVLYAALTGLAIGEATWALNYWAVLALVGGAVLLLVFYVLVGVAELILSGELNRRLLIEYNIVGLLGFLLILSTGPWRP